ncbi:MAG: hypothetical protein ACR2QC_06575 [Gammaproteobacteria bacterium]
MRCSSEKNLQQRRRSYAAAAAKTRRGTDEKQPAAALLCIVSRAATTDFPFGDDRATRDFNAFSPSAKNAAAARKKRRASPAESARPFHILKSRPK